jgi:protein-tyrosine kinase
MAPRDFDFIERVAARLPLEPEHATPSPPTRQVDHWGNQTHSFHNDIAPANDIHILDRRGMVDWSGARTPVMEEIRLIKRRVLRRAANADDSLGASSRLVLITSARIGEGKTFTSCNLALSIALEEDYGVLLVDADITRQTARRNFGIRSTKGLVDLLIDPSLTLPEVLLPTDVPRLSILSAGTISERAPELLASSRMRSLADHLAARFPDRIIIFDSPPCLLSSDTPALAAHVGQALLVVEANKTQEHEISTSLQLISACPDIWLVLNKARLGRSAAYSGYGYGGY